MIFTAREYWKLFFLQASKKKIKVCRLLDTLTLLIGNLDEPTTFHESFILSLMSIVLLSWSAVIWTPYPRLFQLDRPSSLRYTYSNMWEKTEPFDKRAPLSCSHGEVYPHLSHHLTSGREGVTGKAGGQHLYHCELEPTWTSITHCGQWETVPGWFLGPRMCELNRSCALRPLPARKRLKGTLWVS